MTHLLSIAFFLGLLVSLGLLFASMIRRNGLAIRAALSGTWTADLSAETALNRIGTCLRASFPSVEQGALDDDLGRLVLQLSTCASPER